MKALFNGLCITLLLVTPAAWAQSTGSGETGTTSVGTGLADNSPADNVLGGAVQQRAPGRIVEFALARHRGLADARLAAQRSGDTSGLAPEPLEIASGGSLNSLLGGSLTNLINTFLGSGVGDSLNDLLGSTTSTGSQTGTTSGGDFSNLPPEVVQMLAGAGINLSDLNQKTNQGSASATVDKTSSVAQTSDTTVERDFVVRWADAMLSTIFTSAAIGLQTQDFIDTLKDFFRPLFTPPSSDGGDGTSDGDGTGDGGDGGGDGGDGDPII